MPDSTTAANYYNTSNNGLMRGTLSYNKEKRQHIIRGTWSYEKQDDSSGLVFPSKRFELVHKAVRPAEMLEELFAGGDDDELTFHGSFVLGYFHRTSKGKHKARTKVVKESDVKVKFTKTSSSSSSHSCVITGKGTNQLGNFDIHGVSCDSFPFRSRARSRFQSFGSPTVRVCARLEVVIRLGRNGKRKRRFLHKKSRQEGFSLF